MSKQLRISIALVVFAGLVAAVYGLSLWSAQAREEGRRRMRLSGMKSFALCILMYAQDWDGQLPPAAKPDDPYFWVKPLEENPDAYPFGMAVVSLHTKPHPNDHRFIVEHPDQVFEMHADPGLAGMWVQELDDPAAIIFAWDDRPYEFGGRCCAFVDGYVKWFPEDRWRQALRHSKRLIEESKRAGPNEPWPYRKRR